MTRLSKITLFALCLLFISSTGCSSNSTPEEPKVETPAKTVEEKLEEEKSKVTSEGNTQESVDIKISPEEWKIGFQKETAQGTIIEYVRVNEEIETWTELFTVQAFPNLQQHTSVVEFAARVEGALKATCPVLNWNLIKTEEKEAAYEWSISGCEGFDDQYETVKLIAGEMAMYSIHYASKKVPLSDEEKSTWKDIVDGTELM